jgi:hypothetical protein
LVTASDEAILNVASPLVPAIPAVDFQGSIPLGSDLEPPVEGVLDTATRLLPEDSLISPVTVPSRTLRTSDKNQDPSRSCQQNRAWINPDGSLIPINHSLSAQNDQTNSLNGRYLKSRLFGQSHWMNSCFQVSAPSFDQPLTLLLTQGSQFEELIRASSSPLFDVLSPATDLLKKCKTLASQIKASRPLSTPLDLRGCVPTRELCHDLKQAYFRTFEGVFRVLHVPSFERDYDQYWKNPQMADESFVVRLLLVLAIGTCFHEDPGTSDSSLHESSAQWILAANLYLSAPVEKRHLNLGSVQNHCLLLLALQTNTVGGDLTWITAGALVRSAMSVGLHRDPMHFPHMSVYRTELRRRLWYTTLEIAVQASLDSGMPPMISCSDFDCEPPSNIDDCQFDENMISVPQVQCDTTFTDTSMLRTLSRSLPIRIETARILNGLHSDTSYQATIDLGDKLTQACRANSVSFQAYSNTDSLDHNNPSAFTIKMVDTLCRRFLLSLHTPFTHKAAFDYTYYYSRKVCLDTSLLLLSYATLSSASNPAAQYDDFTRLRLVGRGSFRSVLIHAIATVCFEIITDLREDSSPLILAISNSQRFQAVRDAVTLTRLRVQLGETSVKAYVFCSCALAQIEAMQAGVPFEKAVIDAAQRCLEDCRTVLEARLEKTGNIAEENLQSLRGNPDFTYGFDPPTDSFVSIFSEIPSFLLII